MSYRRLFSCVFFSILLAFLTISPSGSTSQDASLQETALIAGRNINMISGKQLPWGDPFLQRQNEPSIAVSSRNPMHILAGANDYRTVDLLIPYEEIPGYEGAAARDAWLGLYKSFDGGQSWKSALLPGFPLDYTNQGSASPLKAYGTAADPVVRAGTSGMFYYCGLAFNRNQTENSVFVARLIDNNNSENQSVDSIKYIDAKIIDKGNAGQFIDKPWLAVDIPRSGAKRVTIQGLGIPSQTISAGNVYLAYSNFTGQAPSNPFSRVYIARSTDCGATWEKATKLSESSHVNQGVTIAISPASGNIYVAWRRFARGNDGHAIMFSYSTDGGKKFSNPKEVAAVQPFDQGTTGTSFRTNTYPALTVDHNGIIYLAWAQRGIGPGGDARIVVSTSANGVNWSTPQAVDSRSGPGHQFMPALSYSAGKVTAVWYDQRYDVSGHWHSYISDEPGQQKRHTIDVRAAQAVASASPFFEASAQVSRYRHLTDADGELHQVQFSPPNYPMFKEGTRPFHGDYVDLTPAPMFLPVSGGGWTYNTDGNQSPVFHAAWTDNRNVKPPKDNNWSNYAPPSSTQDPLFQSTTTCQPGQTSMRNQDVYMASLTRGLIVGSPANMKPLNRLVNKHTFVVFVKNMTSQKRRFRLSIVPVTGVTASFKQFTTLTTLEVEVARYSSVSRTVFATGNVRFASIRVNVEEISGPNGGPVSGGLKGNVVLNPDIENPDIENPDIENNELHNPDIENPDIEIPDIENMNVLNPDIENPDIENSDIINPDIENPDIENPDIENPDIENPGWLNPDIENPDIENPDIENGSLSDYTWKVANTGNTASSYAFKMISAGFNNSQYPGFGFQLLIYRVHTSPAATSLPYSCVLTLKHQDELIANIIKPIIFNPDIENPDIENPDIENPDIENATFWLAPGDKAYITLRVYDPNKNDGVIFDPAVTPITGVTTAQSVNSVNENDAHPTPPISTPITSLTILNDSFPDGTPSTSYSAYLVALGGTPHYTWSKTSGSLPAGLSLNANTGAISGTPTTAGEFSFTVQVTDSSSPAKTATKSFTLKIVESLAPTITEYKESCATIGGDVTIYGINFGSSTGKGVALGGNGIHVDLAVSSWSDTIIIATIPDDSRIRRGLFYYIGIEKADHSMWLSNINKTIEICKIAFHPDQVNDGEATTSYGCGGSPGALFQSFTPGLTPLTAVKLRLRAGGSFPANGINSTVEIRDASPSGTILGTGVTYIHGPISTGEQIEVYFYFPMPIEVATGQPYVIKWTAPGDAILTWMGISDSYSGGTSYGCGGNSDPAIDYIFTTYTWLFGQITDPAGDATPIPNVTSPDLVSATGTVIGSDLVLNVQFAPGTFNPASSCAQFNLDTDQNPLTGHPGVDSGGSDSSLMGTDFFVEMHPFESIPRAYVYKYAGTPNSFTFVGFLNLTLQSNGMEATVPLSLLIDDGRLNFKVTSFAQVGVGSYTGCLDYMPNIGLQPGEIR